MVQKKKEEIKGEIVKCKLLGLCRPDICPAYMELEDWQGCALSLAEIGVTEAIRDGARSLDKFSTLIAIGRALLGPRK